jgi:hypothetical protein
MERWERLPEFLRWILFMPAVLVGTFLVSVISHFFLSATAPGPGWGRVSMIWTHGLTPFTGSFATAAAFLILTFALVPRGKKTAAWCFYLILLAFTALSLLFLLTHRFGTFDFLNKTLGPPTGIAGWEAKDWDDLFVMAGFLFGGTTTFRTCLRLAREDSQKKAALAA